MTVEEIMEEFHQNCKPILANYRYEAASEKLTIYEIELLVLTALGQNNLSIKDKIKEWRYEKKNETNLK